MWFESLFVFTFYSNLKHIPTFQEFRLYKKVRKRWSLPLTEWLFLEPKMVLLRHRSEESFKHLYFSECIVSIAVTHMCKNCLVAVLRGSRKRILCMRFQDLWSKKRDFKPFWVLSERLVQVKTVLMVRRSVELFLLLSRPWTVKYMHLYVSECPSLQVSL